MDLSLLCERETVRNRLESKSDTAQLDSIMKWIMGENPDLRSSGKEIRVVVAEFEEKINQMTREECIQLAKEKFPEILEITQAEKIREKRETLPPLPNAKKGKVIVRFPPEPSGHPHIGHLYASFINRWYADEYEGKLILRFEDTNPQKVKHEFYDIIKKGLQWAGINWDEEAYESKNISTYYSYAEKLVKMGKAYVCTCDRETTAKYRKDSIPCKHRETTPNDQIAEWKKMLASEGYKAGEATLRLKTDMNDPNALMRDPAIFRIIEGDHPLVGNKYRVWPLYDFSASVEDSKLTHVIRSEEFRIRTPLQMLIQELLGLSTPEYIHFSRFKIKGTPVSKRKIRELIASGIIEDWNDIRLSSIAGLGKRGIVPETIKQLAFYLQLTSTQPIIEWSMLLSINRKLIDQTVNRYWAVVDPIVMTIENASEKVATPYLHIDFKDRGTRSLTCKGKVYVSKMDVEELKVGQTLRLKDLYNVKIKEIKTGEVRAMYIGNDTKISPKIQWIPIEQSCSITMLIPDLIYIEDPNNPAEEIINENSLISVDALAEDTVLNLNLDTIVQFERVGFGLLAQKSPKIVFNMVEKPSFLI
ncbi:MAG: glutamate--tRNA ligase [Promethearchaeota archaeon]